MQPKDLPPTYDPHPVEDKWIPVWLENKTFSPENKSDKSFSIVIPPPNVTGSLHMGHALNSTLQDILVRFHRMEGFDTLWVVGTDHAGIATQNVVEKQLAAEGKSRHDLNREDFIKRVWEWKAKSGGTIINQLKRLGASCDFENERFTMDEGLSHAVRKVFVSLYNDGLIYRGLRLINWCPRCQTALSDLEVEHKEQKGSLWTLRYPQVESPEIFLEVATTRPETLFGDTAVAVNPKDERYQSWIGKKVRLPLTNREIPVIADEAVDPTFGSGVVKITPAHDFNDNATGARHHLPSINILNNNGTLNQEAGSYSGLSILKAREQVIKDLEAQELLVKTEPHQNKVGHCYRCATVVEPYLTQQWFVKTKPLAEVAMQAVREGHTKFIPQHWEKTYFQWMENIQDWCISRQIWWGHQIPVWYCFNKASNNCPDIVSETDPKNCPHCGSDKIVQDPDVLDTWFSSGLWPFSTLGWPENTEKLKKFYPTSVLVTAFDIIFFWVARMMMFGCHFMSKDGRSLKDAVPFKDIHIHALVRDPLGQKMSKSKGNVVDPLLMMEKYGTDAFRFTLTILAAQGRDIKMDEAKISGYRNFCNKIWNASRFVLRNISSLSLDGRGIQGEGVHHRVNLWILSELNTTIQNVRNSLGKQEFNEAAKALYHFFWLRFCDWYLELTKEIYRSGTDEEKTETSETSFFVLNTALHLLHPFMPFITEEIASILSSASTPLTKAPYPQALNLPEASHQSAKEIALLIDTVSAIRSIRQETGVSLSAEVPVFIYSTEENKKLLGEIKPLLFSLGKLQSLDFVTDDPLDPSAVAFVRDECFVYIPLAGLIDLQKEKDRLSKNLQKVEKDIEQLSLRLNDPHFLQNAEPDLIEEKKQSLKETTQAKTLILKALKTITRS